MNIVIVGHVDHGKSTIIGRMLADTNSLPKGKLEQVKNTCERNSRPFEYAFLLDALKDEQAQGITIDSARVFFKTKKRPYLIIDAPGHIEFLKNMVTGASQAEAALLVIDAKEGVQENSKRHGYLLSMLGIKQITVLINKMDLVDYSEKVFNSIVSEYDEFLRVINAKSLSYIPVSGINGDNITDVSGRMPWFQGETVLGVLDSFIEKQPDIDKPFRFPVQGVYKFTNYGDDRRIIAGTVVAGKMKIGDEVVFYPSGKRSIVKSIEAFNEQPQQEVSVGKAAGIILDEQIYVTRGEIAMRSNESAPKVTSRLKVSLFWLGKEPMIKKKDYILKSGTIRVSVEIESIERIINASDLSCQNQQEEIRRHDVAECVLKLNKAIAFDLVSKIESTSRFVLVNDYEIAGGGIILEDIKDDQSWVRDKVLLRNYKWIKSGLSIEQRAERFNQKPTLILITGKKNTGRKIFARELEKRLFSEGRLVYYLGIGSVIYGVDADIGHKDIQENAVEHLRRFSEVAHVLLDAGMILIVTAIELTQDALEIIKTTVNPDMIEVVIWAGEDETTDIKYDLKITDVNNLEEWLLEIKSLLQEKGLIFKPW